MAIPVARVSLFGRCVRVAINYMYPNGIVGLFDLCTMRISKCKWHIVISNGIGSSLESLKPSTALNTAMSFDACFHDVVGNIQLSVRGPSIYWS